LKNDVFTVNNIRLWSAKPIAGFDLQSFNAGDYERAVAASQSAETITRVLYPNDKYAKFFIIYEETFH